MLRSKFNDKRNDYNFPIVNTPFFCNNIISESSVNVVNEIKKKGRYEKKLRQRKHILNHLSDRHRVAMKQFMRTLLKHPKWTGSLSLSLFIFWPRGCLSIFWPHGCLSIFWPHGCLSILIKLHLLNKKASVSSDILVGHLYDVTSSSSTSSLGIMRYCTAVDNRKGEKAWYKV
jgi:hypothetical protein